MSTNDTTTGYEDLRSILDEAFEQAASGKGRERHSRGGVPFDRQPIMEIGRMLRSPAGAMFQAIKKTQEASGMIQRGDVSSADREMLGAIVYIAAAVKLLREMTRVNQDAVISKDKIHAGSITAFLHHPVKDDAIAAVERELSSFQGEGEV